MNSSLLSRNADSSEILIRLQKIFGEKRMELKKDVFIYNTLRVHAIAEYFIDARSRDELIQLKQLANIYGIDLRIFGGGSNLAIIHAYIPGIVVKNSYTAIKILEETAQYVDVSVSSGYPVSLLVKETIGAGYAGFEYHKGLPGTVGGALYMNSKWMHPETYFSAPMLYAYIVDGDGNVRKKDKPYFEFAYDYSVLQKTHELLLEGIFRLVKGDKKTLIQKANEALAYRQKTQPNGSGTTGCFFRNIPKGLQEKKHLATNSAGYLIDQAGLKGLVVGNYYVSERHANFVINKGNGNPNDLEKILQIIKSTVKRRFGIELEEEVVII